jgi:hypothetical protein
MGSAGKLSLLTILFPHNPAHPKAEFRPTKGDGFELSTVSQNEKVTDFVYSSSGLTRVHSGGHAMQAEAVLIRELARSTHFWLVRNGTHFSTATGGFESDRPITLFMRGNTGAIVSPGATLTLKGSGMNAVRFDPAAEVLASGADFVRVRLGPGTCTFR